MTTEKVKDEKKINEPKFHVRFLTSAFWWRNEIREIYETCILNGIELMFTENRQQKQQQRWRRWQRTEHKSKSSLFVFAFVSVKFSTKSHLEFD